MPKDSIERIEITRGNSAAVLYGDNVQGGVINIVTKTAVGLPPWARLEAGYGSFNHREANFSYRNEPVVGDREVEHVGADGADVDDRGALAAHAADEAARDLRG